MAARLKDRYQTELRPQLMSDYDLRNLHAVPSLRKITVNMGVGKAIENNKRLEVAQKEIAQITGQSPSIRKAKKSISNFKLRQGYSVGCKVTLRRDRMFEFLDRLIQVVIPRIRDFRGFPSGSFDGRGNYSMGLADQVVFPEINIDRVEYVQGMDICFTISNSDDEKSLALMKGFGFPFRTDR